jgi:hypothetical protein
MGSLPTAMSLPVSPKRRRPEHLGGCYGDSLPPGGLPAFRIARAQYLLHGAHGVPAHAEIRKHSVLVSKGDLLARKTPKPPDRGAKSAREDRHTSLSPRTRGVILAVVALPARDEEKHVLEGKPRSRFVHGRRGARGIQEGQRRSSTARVDSWPLGEPGSASIREPHFGTTRWVPFPRRAISGNH